MLSARLCAYQKTNMNPFPRWGRQAALLLLAGAMATLTGCNKPEPVAIQPDLNAQIQHVQNSPDLTPEQKTKMIASLKAIQQSKSTK